MNLDIRVEGTKEDVVLALCGRLDTITSPELESTLQEVLPSAQNLTFDFKSLIYISSAGLRDLLKAQKAMNAKGGKMIVRNVCDNVLEVFSITGFDNVLTIE